MWCIYPLTGFLQRPHVKTLCCQLGLINLRLNKSISSPHLPQTTTITISLYLQEIISSGRDHPQYVTHSPARMFSWGVITYSAFAVCRAWESHSYTDLLLLYNTWKTGRCNSSCLSFKAFKLITEQWNWLNERLSQKGVESIWMCVQSKLFRVFIYFPAWGNFITT